jgi:hypothetical protein
MSVLLRAVSFYSLSARCAVKFDCHEPAVLLARACTLGVCMCCIVALLITCLGVVAVQAVSSEQKN